MKTLFVLPMIFTVLFFACQKTISPSSHKDSSNITIFLTDNPSIIFDRVFIDLQKLEIKIENDGIDSLSGWITLNIRPGVYDILKFRNGLDTLFATGEIPGGRKLQKIRLSLGNDNSIVKDGKTFPLFLHDDENAVVVNLEEGNIDFNAPGQIQFWIDFDAGNSIREKDGKFELRSHIKIFSKEKKGSIEGRVLPAEAHAMVWAIQGTDTASALPEAEGEFKIMGLNPGNYRLLFHATTNNYMDTTISDVLVQRDEDTEIGIVNLRK